MVDIRITLDTRRVNRMMKKLTPALRKNLGKATLEFATIAKKSIKRQFKMQRKKAPRDRLANLMKVKRLSQLKVVVSIPLRAHYLDTMRPHYVSLRRGRNITRWARRWYNPSLRKRGRSRVFRGPGGGIKPSSFLWVTKDPFVEKGINRIKGRGKTILRKVVKKSIKEAK